MVDHIAFIVDDIKAATSWYTDRIGAKVVYCDESWAMLEIFGTKLALVLPGSHPAHFAIKCASIKDFPCAESEVKSHRDASQFYYLKDPYGNAIEWIHYPEKHDEE
tara:strand:+ start:3018 stop:3335 length:318 start_codon:yes stop_codon:yes gene_type:complete